MGLDLNAKPESKYQKYWMAKVPDTTGLTNVLGRKEQTLIAFKEEDLLCKILLAEVEDMGKLREVMCLPRSPKTILEDMKGESMCWVRGMLAKLMREECLKRGLVAWDVIMEEGSKVAESSVTFDEKHYLFKWLGTFAIHFWNWWTIDLRNREKSDVGVKCFGRLESRGDADLAKEWLFRKSDSQKLEDHASFVKRMNAYRNYDSPTSESSRIEDEGGKDMKGPDTSPSLLFSKKPRPRAGEVVAKGKRTEATGVIKTARPKCQPSSRTQPRVPVVLSSKSKSGFGDSDCDTENQAKNSRKSTLPSNYTTLSEYPVGHGKRKRLVHPVSPSPLSFPQVPVSKRM